jgi:hypothetical protein
MRKELSKIAKARFIIQIINDLKELDKSFMYINSDGYDEDGIINKIAKKAGVYYESYRGEAGNIDISEYIQITYDYIEDYELKRINGEKSRPFDNRRHIPQFLVSEDLKLKVKEFEDKNIPSSGPCKTLFGEIFRAIQRIQYRAYNDGDYCWQIGSPTFMSYIFLISQIDKLNYSYKAYNQETGEYGFEFTDPFLKKNSWDGKISNIIETPLADDADFIKYQLMDLILNNKIEDEKNVWNSRSYTKIEKEYSY